MTSNVTRLERPAKQALVDTDVANARRLAVRHGEAIRYTTVGGWRVYDGVRWGSDEKGVKVQALAVDTATAIFDEIKGAADRDAMMMHARRSQSRKSIEAMISLARSESGIAASITDFDSDSWLLNLRNGTYELRNGVIRSHRREDLISKVIPIDFNPRAKCEVWDAFLRRVVDHNDDLYAYLRRFVGYLLVGDTSDQSLHFLYGQGANGKSVFCEVLMRLLGDYAVTASSDLIMLKRHAGIPNDVARLRGVRVAIMNETSQGSRFDEAKLKDLTGGDTLTARFLHQEYFDFVPTHRLLIRGNHKPTIVGTDEAIWRRLRILPFLVTIPPDEQDGDLLRKLEVELPGILNWALQGCREWQGTGLKPPSIISEAVLKYRDESDMFGRFIEECCTTQASASIMASDIYAAYQKFAEEAGERGIHARDFAAEMLHRGYERKRMNSGMKYCGVGLARHSRAHRE
jgi:putative DNA primase/helicase